MTENRAMHNISITEFWYYITVPVFSQVLQRLSEEGNHLSAGIWSVIRTQFKVNALVVVGHKNIAS
jgi:hypothetical protein